MAARAHHVVVSASGGWSVLRAGASRASRVFATRKAAIDWGTEISRRERVELYIHRRDGSIEDKRSYAERSTDRGQATALAS